MKVETNIKCEWLKELDPIVYKDNRIQKIFQFFVINSPVNGLSARTIDLKTYGWNKPWNKKYYLNKQLKEITANHILMYSAQTYDEMDITLEKASLLNDFPSDFSTEKIVVVNNKKNQFISTFYHIRNSIAHGRFNIERDTADWTLIFEDVVKGNAEGKVKISARMVLKVSTLLAWVELIEGGESDYIKIE